MNTISQTFQAYFKNVTTEAVASYQYYVEHDYSDEGDFTIDSQVVYELFAQDHDRDDLSLDNNNGDADTFGFIDNQALLKSVHEYFAKDTLQIYQIDPAWFKAVSQFYMDQTGIVFKDLPAQITTPYLFSQDDHYYVAIDNLDFANEDLIQQTLNWAIFGGNNQNTNAVDYFAHNFTFPK